MCMCVCVSEWVCLCVNELSPINAQVFLHKVQIVLRLIRLRPRRELVTTHTHTHTHTHSLCVSNCYHLLSGRTSFPGIQERCRFPLEQKESVADTGKEFRSFLVYCLINHWSLTNLLMYSVLERCFSP